MKIVTIGRGSVGGGLATLWRKAGHEVTMLGRDGGDASDADVVLVAVPGPAVSAALGKVTGLAGKIAVTTGQAAGSAFWERRHRRQHDVGRPSSPQTMAAQSAAIADWREVRGQRFAELVSITPPTLVVNGSKDVMIPTINSYWLSQHIPNAQLIIYPARYLEGGDEPVVLAAKDASRVEALAHELGPLARAASVQDAIGGADVVVDPSNPLGFDENGRCRSTCVQTAIPRNDGAVRTPRLARNPKGATHVSRVREVPRHPRPAIQHKRSRPCSCG